MNGIDPTQAAHNNGGPMQTLGYMGGQLIVS